MEILGDILKRVTHDATSRNTNDGGGIRLESDGDEPKCPLCLGLGWVSREAKVGDPDFGELFPCRCRKEELARTRMRGLQRYSGLSKNMLESMTFERFIVDRSDVDVEGRTFLEAAYTAARSFAQQPDGWLLITGAHGNGKTHLAVAIVNECIKRGSLSHYAFVPDLLDHLRETFGPDSSVGYDWLFQRVRSAPLLILDDMGAEVSTVWAKEKLYQIVVHRYNARIPTVITTYLTMDEIEEEHPRLASRLRDTTVVNWVPIGAPDYRDNSRNRSNSRRRGI